MTIDPAKFIVRDEAYPQERHYPYRCAQTVRKLMELRPATVSELMDIIKDANLSHSQAYGFGERRDRSESATNFVTPLVGRYAKVYQRFLEREFGTSSHFQPFEKQFSATLWKNGEEKPVSLSKIVTRHSDDTSLADEERCITKLYHPSKDVQNAELLSDLITTAYNNACNLGLPLDDRKNAALEFYYFFSQDAGFHKGSATCARIALAYLEEIIGFDLPFTKSEFDLNTEAITRSPEQWKKDVNSDLFFDAKCDSRTILKWHETVTRSVIQK